MSDLARFQEISPVLARPSVLFYSKRTALAEGIAESLRNMVDATVTVVSAQDEIEPILHSGRFSVLFIDCVNYKQRLISEIQEKIPSNSEIAIATLFDELDGEIISYLLDRGVKGIMVTSAQMKTISAAIQMLSAGECYVTGHFIPTPAAKSRLTQSIFSGRELNVLNGLTRGLTNQQIGEELDLALPTVKMYVSSVFRKLGVRSRLEAAVVARRIMPSAFSDG